jgi:hypothetical protein
LHTLGISFLQCCENTVIGYVKVVAIIYTKLNTVQPPPLIFYEGLNTQALYLVNNVVRMK